MEFELYFVAHFKHDAAQHLISGPYLDWSDANDAIEVGESQSRCIVKTNLQFTMDENTRRGE